MKKLITVMIVVCLVSMTLIGCSSDKKDDNKKETISTEAAKKETASTESTKEETASTESTKEDAATTKRPTNLEDMSIKDLNALKAAVTAVINGDPVESDDFAYLEEMSVKEVKDLKDEIDALLGNDGDSSADEGDSHPEWADLDAKSDPYQTAIILASTLKESLYDRDSFQLNAVYYYKQGSYDWYVLEYSGANKLGGMTGAAILFKMKDGSLVKYYEKNSNFHNYFPDEYDLYWDMHDGDIGETLNYQFIEYHVE